MQKFYHSGQRPGVFGLQSRSEDKKWLDFLRHFVSDLLIMQFFVSSRTSDALRCASCATFLFLPHFDVICDLLLNRCTATWNLFVNWICCWGWHVLMSRYRVSKTLWSQAGELKILLRIIIYQMNLIVTRIMRHNVCSYLTSHSILIGVGSGMRH